MSLYKYKNFHYQILVYCNKTLLPNYLDVAKDSRRTDHVKNGKSPSEKYLLYKYKPSTISSQKNNSLRVLFSCGKLESFLKF